MPKITLGKLKKAINDQSDRIIGYKEIFSFLVEKHPEIDITVKTPKYWMHTIPQKVAEELRNTLADNPDTDFNKHIYLRFGSPGDYCIPVLVEEPKGEYFYANANHNCGCDLGIYTKFFKQPIEDYKDYCIQTWGAKVISKEVYMGGLRSVPIVPTSQIHPEIKETPAMSPDVPTYVEPDESGRAYHRGRTEIQTLKSLKERQRIK